MLPNFNLVEPRFCDNRIKAKPNSNCANNSMSNVGNPLTIFWAPSKGLDYFSLSTLWGMRKPSSISSWLHSTIAAVLGGHPLVLPIWDLQKWSGVLWCNWALYVSSMASPEVSSWCQDSSSFHYPPMLDIKCYWSSVFSNGLPLPFTVPSSVVFHHCIMPSKLESPGWLVHVYFNCYCQVVPLPPLKHRSLRKGFPEDLTSVMLVSS